ncbi:MAG TPA: hypothetical protein VEZ48_10790 [Sphingomonadaceae bacterium]|jgi:hypothetical protein|nr:hypothetical protein [Sphingomonadaceae bacterium]
MLIALTLLAAQPAEAPEIVVTAPCHLKARQLLPALRAYRKGRGARAPGSTLFFETDPAAARGGVTPAMLRIHSGGMTRPVPADSAGRFVLPADPPDDLQITGPCHDGTLAISPLVMSPGTDAADRRLGDLRLQCAVGWAMAKQALAETTGVFMRVLGECAGTRNALANSSARPIAEAVVTHGSVTRPLPVREGGFGYSVPLGDKRLPDAARVRFRFR